MKKILSLIILCTILYITYTYKEQINEYIIKNFINDKLIVTYENNIYAKSNTNDYQTTDNFYPQNKSDIMDIFFTALNGGWENVNFFCTKKYENCLNDITELANNSKEFTKINNYVHPYNSYKRIVLNYNTLGKVSINIEKLYNNDEINKINKKVDEIINSIIDEKMSDKEKIKAIHDYIINNTKYDEESAEKIKNKEKLDNFISHKANGTLLEGKAICGGYSDAMAIFLDRFNISNYKLTSNIHVWNYVLLDNNWYHLDLTWDDPITNTNEDVLIHTFFLITEKELQKLNTGEHNYY